MFLDLWSFLLHMFFLLRPISLKASIFHLQGCHFTLYCKEYSLFLTKWKITLYYSLFQALLFIFRKALYILFIFGVKVVNLR